MILALLMILGFSLLIVGAWIEYRIELTKFIKEKKEERENLF